MKVYKKEYNERRAHYLPEWKEVGAIIAQKRKEKGFTRAEMAKKLGLSTSYLIHLETGYNNPRTIKTTAKAELIVLLGEEVGKALL